MWSYSNYIPLPASAIERIVKSVEPFDFDRVYGAFRARWQGGGQEVGGAVSAGLRALIQENPQDQ